jgi:hypothetical protein
MNIANNMEAIFVVAIALASATGLAGAAVPAHLTLSPSARVASASHVAVVTVHGKRLSAAQKAAFDAAA